MEVNWAYDEAQSAVATKATDDDSSFMAVISGIFQECGRVLKRHTGRLVFTFHHWDPNAWAELTIGLKSAGFKLMNYYVVSSEHPVSVHINNLNAITHDAILALALDGNSPTERWPSLTRINTTQSERFCQQCSAALGWLLESPHSSAEIRAIWKNLIQGRIPGFGPNSPSNSISLTMSDSARRAVLGAANAAGDGGLSLNVTLSN